MSLYWNQKRALVLLEVLIAFALIVLCILPLISPHVFILKAERRFVNTVKLDHAVNLLYANRLEKLYQQKIPWQDIEGGKELSIDAPMLRDSGYQEFLPFTGTYRFEEQKSKHSDPPENSVYLYDLIFTFVDEAKANTYKYKYKVVIERKYR
jgi:hypothetical protein